MRTNVVFLSTFYRPSFAQSVGLEKLQEKIHWARAEIAYECRGLSKNQLETQLSNFHWGLRRSWKVYTNETSQRVG